MSLGRYYQRVYYLKRFETYFWRKWKKITQIYDFLSENLNKNLILLLYRQCRGKWFLKSVNYLLVYFYISRYASNTLQIVLESRPSDMSCISLAPTSLVYLWGLVYSLIVFPLYSRPANLPIFEATGSMAEVVVSVCMEGKVSSLEWSLDLWLMLFLNVENFFVVLKAAERRFIVGVISSVSIRQYWPNVTLDDRYLWPSKSQHLLTKRQAKHLYFVFSLCGPIYSWVSSAGFVITDFLLRDLGAVRILFLKRLTYSLRTLIR